MNRVFYKEKEALEEQHWKKNYDPYEQDLFNFPDSKMRIYRNIFIIKFQRLQDLRRKLPTI